MNPTVRIPTIRVREDWRRFPLSEENVNRHYRSDCWLFLPLLLEKKIRGWIGWQLSIVIVIQQIVKQTSCQCLTRVNNRAECWSDLAPIFYLCCAFKPESFAWTVTRFNCGKYVNISSPVCSAKNRKEKKRMKGLSWEVITRKCQRHFHMRRMWTHQRLMLMISINTQPVCIRFYGAVIQSIAWHVFFGIDLTGYITTCKEKQSGILMACIWFGWNTKRGCERQNYCRNCLSWRWKCEKTSKHPFGRVAHFVCSLMDTNEQLPGLMSVLTSIVDGWLLVLRIF